MRDVEKQMQVCEQRAQEFIESLAVLNNVVQADRRLPSDTRKLWALQMKRSRYRGGNYGLVGLLKLLIRFADLVWALKTVSYHR